MDTPGHDRGRIEELRQREEKGGPLSSEERAELDAFYARVEAAEAAYLLPAVERAREDRLRREEYLRKLERLRERKEASLAVLESVIREIESLRSEEQRLRAALTDV